MLKLVQLVLTVPVTNAVNERSCSTLYRTKTYLRSSMTQERLSFCLILAAYKEKIYKLKLIEVANRLISKMNIAFSFKNRHFPTKFTESAAKGTETSNQGCSSGETQTC